MLKISFELEDVKGSFEAVGLEGGNWRLTASDEESRDSKIVNTFQMCCILYSMHDELDAHVDNPVNKSVYEVAAEALKEFSVQLIP